MYRYKIKFKDFIKISEAFSTEVSLKRDFYNKEINFEKLRGYVPSESSRNALKGILRGFHPQSSYRVHFITGSYGVGKSHLGLILANYLSLDIKDENLEPFLEKVKEKDEQLYKDLISKRSRIKPFLIVIPSPLGDPLGFKHALISALKGTLENLNIDYEPKTYYSTAINRIQYWQRNEPEALERLNNSLNRRNLDINIFVRRLKNYDKNSLNEFFNIHKEVAFGVPLLFEEYKNIEEIYSDVANIIRKEYGYQGIIIIFDEFGRYIRQMAEDPFGEQGLQLQEFLEFCKRSDENQCHLIAIAHMSLKDYIEGKIAQEEWEKIFGRFEGSEYYITFLSKEYEIDDLIDSIIIQNFKSQEWQNLIKANNQLNQLIYIVEKLDLYKNKEREWIKRIIINGCFPLHPLTTYVLTYISEKIGQRTRTLFRFINDPLPGGLKNFVENEYLYKENNNFNLYTIDKLFDYFETAIKESKDTSSIYQGYEDAKVYSQEEGLSEIALKIIATILVVNSPILRPTFDTIANAMNLEVDRREELRKILIELIDNKALYLKRKTNEYLFPKGIKKDIEEYINKEVESVRPNFNLISILNSEFSVDPIYARSYNDENFCNRKANCQYIIPASLSNPIQYVNHINFQYNPKCKKYTGDILILFVICENEEDIQKTKNYASSHECQHPQLIIAVPKNPIKISETILQYMAIKRLFEKSRSEIEISELKDEISEEYINIREIIREKINEYREADNIIWYRNKNINSNLKKGSEEKYISERMYSLFPNTPIFHRNTIAHNIEKTDVDKKHRLNAMGKILGTKGPFAIKKTGLSAGDAILNAVYMENDMLKKIKDKGISCTYELKDPPPKTKLYNIWEMLSEKFLVKDEPIYPENIIKNLLEPPFGLTKQSIDLLLAGFFRGKSDQFRIRSNRIKAEKKGNLNLFQNEILNDNTIYWLVRNPADFQLNFKEVSPLLKQYINNLIKVVNISFEMETGIYLYDGARNELLKWFNEVPEITKNCEKFDYEWTKKFLNIFQKKDVKSRDMILIEIPKALGIKQRYEDWDKDVIGRIIGNFEKVVIELNNFHNNIGDRIIEKLAFLFNSIGKTDKELENAIAKWFGNLPESTRLHTFMKADAQVLLYYSKISGSIRDKFLVDLPEKYGMKSYINWQSDKTDELIERIQKAKKIIEKRGEISPQNDIKYLHNTIKEFIFSLKSKFGVKLIIEVLKKIIEELKVD